MFFTFSLLYARLTSFVTGGQINNKTKGPIQFEGVLGTTTSSGFVRFLRPVRRRYDLTPPLPLKSTTSSNRLLTPRFPSQFFNAAAAIFGFCRYPKIAPTTTFPSLRWKDFFFNNWCGRKGSDYFTTKVNTEVRSVNYSFYTTGGLQGVCFPTPRRQGVTSSSLQSKCTTPFLDRQPETRPDVRNVAIVAHVDHGKTTLVDALLKHAEAFKLNAQVQFRERFMDSNVQERLRGITILAKNTAINYKGIKINIVDTPGHVDFGGEVERVINMVDGAILVVDAVEGPKPQTRFVLRNAIKAGCEILLVVNKCDRPGAKPQEAVAKTFDLFVELDASDDQIEFKTVYTSAITLQSGPSPDQMAPDMSHLFDRIFEIKGPCKNLGKSLQMQISSVLPDTYRGNLAVGRITAGEVRKGQVVGVAKEGRPPTRAVVGDVLLFNNLTKEPVPVARAGDIAVISGMTGYNIGDTLVDLKDPRPLPRIHILEPTVRVTVSASRSPLAGKDPKTKHYSTADLKARLEKELLTNVALRMENVRTTDSFIVSGRGQMHLTVLLENMRSEGYEFTVAAPDVLDREIDGAMCEPWDTLTCTCLPEQVGPLMKLMQLRKGEHQSITPEYAEKMTMVKYLVPTRFTIGLRSKLLELTRGVGTVELIHETYRARVNESVKRERGSLLANSEGTISSRGVSKAQEHGPTFITPGTEVYDGMVVGISSKHHDIKLNVCKEKHLTNLRSVGSNTKYDLDPPSSELIEVTPSFVRMAKKTAMTH